MYIHKEKKVAFIAHPRTASQATAKVLVGKLGFESVTSHHKYGPSPDSWTVFATVRNPFDLLVSWHYLEIFKTKHDIPFPDWLRKIIAEPNNYMQMGLFFGLEFCTDVLHFENLQEEFDQLMVKVGLPTVEIPLLNVSTRRNHRSFTDYYTPELIDLVVKKYGETIRNFDYSTTRST